MDKLYQEHEPAKRHQLIKDNCLASEMATIQVPLSPDESLSVSNTILNCSDVLDKLSAELAKKEATYKAEKKELQTKMNPFQLDLSVAVQSRRTGTKQLQEEVYFFDDQDLGIMITYNKQGNAIASRPLTPKERQSSIFSLNAKTGTHGER